MEFRTINGDEEIFKRTKIKYENFFNQYKELVAGTTDSEESGKVSSYANAIIKLIINYNKVKELESPHSIKFVNFYKSIQQTDSIKAYNRFPNSNLNLRILRSKLKKTLL